MVLVKDREGFFIPSPLKVGPDPANTAFHIEANRIAGGCINTLATLFDHPDSFCFSPTLECRHWQLELYTPSPSELVDEARLELETIQL